ncbi:DNA topoisomerase [Oribacterium asaccharolyticum]|uniref:DNA topoisomerase n=1 Tax=Oribacterium asaccharolyticum TaxID=1501332 RepID=UPI0028E25A81|nr:DNA topoisomerase [Oribacterium asaccharolyticum]
MKKLFIAEKPSVAKQFAEALGVATGGGNRGYLENQDYIFTWCVGHLISMSYPEKYDEELKKWKMESLPFIPKEYLYEVIPSVKEQFSVVSALLQRKDLETIYICTDSGREGEYIYRLVASQCPEITAEEKRVWIDSQTKEEILRGIRDAKAKTAYDRLGTAAYLRAKEDYLMGINFSRVLTLRFGRELARALGKEKSTVIAVGRVMSCVLAMIVQREMEIRAFQKTSFWKVIGDFSLDGESAALSCEFRGKEESKYYREADLYKNMGFLQAEKAKAFQEIFRPNPQEGSITSLEKKKEVKNPPLLFNLAELQNECAKILKISPDDTLKLVQELYEKKLCTYPRTDARVLSTAVSKEIEKNIRGLSAFPQYLPFAKDILERKSYSGIAKTKYCDDKKITDHYAIIPTGQGRAQYNSLGTLQKKVFDFIVRRFLSIFYPSAEYKKYNLSITVLEEEFLASEKQLEKPGYLQLYEKSIEKEEKEGDSENEENRVSGLSGLSGLKKGSKVYLMSTALKEGETSPPKRYTSGTMILAMENAGKLIEDESLREQIKGSGIGTSATRAGILTKLEKNEYIHLDKKNQQLSPSLLGEKIVRILWNSIPSLLNPTLTASWEKGLSYVEEGKIEEKEYMDKLEDFVRKNTEKVKFA